MSSEAVICVVDDDEEVRESIGTFFRSAGIAVVRFGTGEDLLAWPHLQTMRCLITDLHMPGMDGLALGRALKRQGHAAPVILMTAFPTTEARAQAEALNVAAFVAKPTDPEALLDMVEGLLDR